MSRRLLGLLPPLLFGACVSRTLLRSEPLGANVYLDGKFVGRTPYNMADAKLAGMRTRVRLERAGFQTLHADLFRNENLEPGPLMLGIPSLGVTWFWVLGYAPEHGYLMTPASIPATHPATTPPPDL